MSTPQPDLDEVSSGGRGRPRRRLIRMVAVLVVVGLAAQLYLATTEGDSLPTDAVALPTNHWNGGNSLTALLHGRVEGSASVGGGCVWIESDFGGRVPVVWPAGFHVTFDPVRIYDRSGRIVAREGDTIEAGGGLNPVPGPRCMFGQVDAFSIQSSINVVEG